MSTHKITKVILATFCLASSLRLEPASAACTLMCAKFRSLGSRVCSLFSPKTDVSRIGSESERRKILYDALWELSPHMPKELVVLILEYACEGFVYGAPVRSIALQGNFLAIGGDSGKVQLWDLEKPLKEGVVLGRHADAVSALSFQKDPFDSAKLTLVSASMLRNARVSSIEVSPAENNASQEPELHVVAQGECEMKSRDEAIRIWDPVTATLLTSLEADRQHVPRYCKRQIEQAEETQCAQSALAQPIVLTRYCRNWSLASKKHLEDFLKIRLMPRPVAAEKSSKNRFGSISEERMLEVTPDGKILIHDVKTQITHVLQGHKGRINDLVFSKVMPNYLASAADDGVIKIWDINKGLCIQTITEHTSPVRYLAFLEGKWQIASASDDGVVKIHALTKELCPSDAYCTAVGTAIDKS